MTRQLYAANDAERVLVPCTMDVSPHPEANPTSTYVYQAALARASWAYIVHGYRAWRAGSVDHAWQAWELYIRELDR